jgi:hypothetical protein
LSAGAYVPCLRGYPTPPLRSSCQLDGAPSEGCLTEVWPEASGHTRWRNEMVRRGNHHYSEGRQRLWTPPPVVSRGPRERRCPLVRGSCWLTSCRKIRRAGVLGPARGLSWPARLSGGAAFLERTSWVIGAALDRGVRSGGCHVSREAGLPGLVALEAKAASRAC